MSKTITGAMPIRTVGLTPGHRWCGGLRSVKPAVNNGKGEHGLVHGPNSLNATYIHPGRISDRPRKLAKNLRNGHLVHRVRRAIHASRRTASHPQSAPSHFDPITVAWGNATFGSLEPRFSHRESALQTRRVRSGAMDFQGVWSPFPLKGDVAAC